MNKKLVFLTLIFSAPLLHADLVVNKWKNKWAYGEDYKYLNKTHNPLFLGLAWEKVAFNPSKADSRPMDINWEKVTFNPSKVDTGPMDIDNENSEELIAKLWGEHDFESYKKLLKSKNNDPEVKNAGIKWFLDNKNIDKKSKITIETVDTSNDFVRQASGSNTCGFNATYSAKKNLHKAFGIQTHDEFTLADWQRHIRKDNNLDEDEIKRLIQYTDKANYPKYVVIPSISYFTPQGLGYSDEEFKEFLETQRAFQTNKSATMAFIIGDMKNGKNKAGQETRGDIGHWISAVAHADGLGKVKLYYADSLHNPVDENLVKKIKHLLKDDPDRLYIVRKYGHQITDPSTLQTSSGRLRSYKDIIELAQKDGDTKSDYFNQFYITQIITSLNDLASPPESGTPLLDDEDVLDIVEISQMIAQIEHQDNQIRSLRNYSDLHALLSGHQGVIDRDSHLYELLNKPVQQK